MSRIWREHRVLVNVDHHSMETFELGEKLYVTADKRSDKKGGCRRPLCWTLAALVVAAAVVLVILTATGILFTNSPTPVDQYNSTIGSARALGGITDLLHNHVDHDHDHDHHDHHDHDHHDHDHHDHNHGMEGHVHGSSEEAEHADMPSFDVQSNYVPRTLEGEVKIDNEVYTAPLSDPESEEYRIFKDNFVPALTRILSDSLETADGTLAVEIVSIRNGSVVVVYRVYWESNEAPQDEMNVTPETMKATLNEYLARNDRMINVYHISEENLETQRVIDQCTDNKNGCEYGCEFDKTTLDFMCVCPQGKMLFGKNGKKCVNILDVNESSRANTGFDWQQVHQTSAETNERSTEPGNAYPNIFGDDHEHKDSSSFEEHKHYPDPTAEPKPEPSAEPEPSPEPKSEPESSAEPKAEPEPTAELKTEPEPTAEPKAEPEPTAEPKAEPEPQAEPESTAEPKLGPEPADEPKAEPEPAAEPKPEPEPAAEPKAEPEPIAEPKAEPEPTAEPKPEPEPTAEPKAEPEPQAEPEPTAEPKSEPEPADEPKAEPEPTAEPKTEPEPTAEPKAEPEPIAEPKAEPEPTAEPKAEPEPTAEPKAEPEPTAEPKSEPEPTAEPKAEPEPASEPEPSVEPKSEPEPSPEPKPERESTSESVPAAEPTADSKTDFELSVEPLAEPKPSSESKPEPEPEPTAEPKNDLDPKFESPSEVSPEPASEPEAEPALSAESEPITEPKQDSSVKPAQEHSEEPKSEPGPSDEPATTTESKVETSVELKQTKPIVEESHESPTDIVRALDHIQKMNSADSDFEITQSTNISSSETPESDKSTVPESSTESQTMSTSTTETINSLSESTAYLKPGVVITSQSVSSETDISESENSHSKISENEPFAKLDPTITYPMTHIMTEQGNAGELTVLPASTPSNESDGANPSLPTNVTTMPLGENESSYDDVSKTQSPSSDGKKSTSEEEVTFGLIQTVPNIKSTTSDPILDNVSTTDNSNSQINIDVKTEKTEIDEKVSHNNGLRQEDARFLKHDENSNVETTTKSSSEEETSFEMINLENTNKNGKDNTNQQTTTTETATTEENFSSISKGTFGDEVKDDFVPDYITNSHVNKQTDEEPLLPGLMSDYEIQDLRSKRTKSNVTDENSTDLENVKTTPSIIIDNAMNENSTKTVSNISENTKKNTSTSTEPTTVSEYIYKQANRSPAPVWESGDTESDMNVTQTPNLNVTIYEVSNHNIENSKMNSTGSTVSSTEYEDHETEMNPFLPEVENNKSLVKKLQEGHDIDPSNLNETQNESNDEHNSNNNLAMINSEILSLNKTLYDTKLNDTEDEYLQNDVTTRGNNQPESTTSTVEEQGTEIVPTTDDEMMFNLDHLQKHDTYVPSSKNKTETEEDSMAVASVNEDNAKSVDDEKSVTDSTEQSLTTTETITIPVNTVKVDEANTFLIDTVDTSTNRHVEAQTSPYDWNSAELSVVPISKTHSDNSDNVDAEKKHYEKEISKSEDDEKVVNFESSKDGNQDYLNDISDTLTRSERTIDSTKFNNDS
ncbi:protein piccolo isoform X2 [Plutella xylostella]|uniref:protein piccolo isoform X2 n=1 Tax=Plutella xylostella TaxID=51655 RepID=UPI002032F395|nr:protein piccolo isoform X2 [Plutella xylostella]